MVTPFQIRLIPGINREIGMTYENDQNTGIVIPYFDCLISIPHQ